MNDWTRQTRWAYPPLPAPAGAPPGGAFVRELTWAICRACDLQVHGALLQTADHGARCPECGGSLTPPLVALGARARERVQAEEARLAERLDGEDTVG